MKLLQCVFAGMIVSTPALSRTQSAEETIENLAGCFEVTYRFVEDGVQDYGPLTIRELITMARTGSEFFLEHYQVNGSQSFKHFTETWAPAGELWQQTVRSANGEMRYECAAPLQMRQWRCEADGAPKPRRDVARTDYATLDRESTVQFTPAGWVQAETNVKRAADGSAVSREVGWIEYRRLDASACAGVTIPRR